MKKSSSCGRNRNRSSECLIYVLFIKPLHNLYLHKSPLLSILLVKMTFSGLGSSIKYVIGVSMGLLKVLWYISLFCEVNHKMLLAFWILKSLNFSLLLLCLFWWFCFFPFLHPSLTTLILHDAPIQIILLSIFTFFTSLHMERWK